jgi:hypothetical protein
LRLAAKLAARARLACCRTAVVAAVEAARPMVRAAALALVVDAAKASTAAAAVTAW